MGKWVGIHTRRPSKWVEFHTRAPQAPTSDVYVKEARVLPAPLQRRHNLAAIRPVPVLAQIDALPGPQGQMAMTDGSTRDDDHL